MRFVTSAVLMISLLTATAAAAAEVKVEYKDYKKYTDLKAATEPRGSFEKRTLASFDKIFADLAKKLPEGYSWNVVVTDIDLAGDVNYMFTQAGQQIRVIKDIFIPRINFSYTLVDQNKTLVIEEKDVKLKDMGFMDRTSNVRANQPLEHERIMLERWFKDKLEPVVVSHQQTQPKAN